MESVTFQTQDGIRLEGELRLPKGSPVAASVICHPHPKHGGSKDHPILWALRNELAGRRGHAVLLFNFRGVMGSAGSYSGGHGELADVGGAIAAVRLSAPDVPVMVTGWSFGANVALREAIDDERVEALALLGIPLRPGDLTLPALPAPSVLHSLRRPAYFLAGDGDEYCPAGELRSLAESIPKSEVAILEGTDHYMWRREREAAEMVGDFAQRVLRSI
jgi:alpha/beta superfamily hydrolase